jgi:outer membrane protein OmpA-like peptidoglycan-associated protein
MKLTMRTLFTAAAVPVLLSACDNADLAKRTEFPNPAGHTYVSSTAGSQMVAEASGRKRVRDLRAEVTGNIAYLRSHLGEERSHILDMQDSLLVSLPGRAAFTQSGGATLTDSGIDAVARIAASMIEFPHTRITIAGHVKGTNSDQRDQVLSERRAVAVKSVLMSHGIDACRIGVLGKGSDDHIAAPVSERRNQYNDRIEVLMKPYQDGACV